MPWVPIAFVTSVIACTTRPGATPGISAFPASNSKASACSASPASTAIASPYSTWQVGWPRRVGESSIAGRSSWIRE